MTKTTALTFATAVVLLVAAVTFEFYGHYSVAKQRSAAGDSPGFIITDGHEMDLDAWEQAAGLTGLLAITVSLVGAMLWDREDPPKLARTSILMLDGAKAGPIVRATKPLKNRCATAELRVDESRRRIQDDESLTPLERVIRGY